MAAPFVLDALGTALNARSSARLAKENEAAKTADMLRRMELQRRLIEAEKAKQQEFARQSRDVFDNNVNLFGNAAGQINDQSGALAQMFMDALASGAAPQNVPAAGAGAVADREAGMMTDAQARSQGDGQNLANLQGFGQMMQNIGVQATRNNSIADIISNFAQGSRNTLTPALQAANVSHYVPGVDTNYLGDMLKFGARMAMQPPAQPNPHALLPEGNYSGIGLRGTGGEGFAGGLPSLRFQPDGMGLIPPTLKPDNPAGFRLPSLGIGR